MLSESELRTLESTLLPALERHHLRLLAHGLRTLQAVVGAGGALPSRDALAAWAAAQPAIAADPGFRDAFVDQMLGLGVQLESIATTTTTTAVARAEAPASRGPLDLELDDLVRWARAQADRRLIGAEPTSPPPG
jgi:hypothetical protein